MYDLIVTSTKPYIDIDAYGSGVAYAYLLRQLGQSAHFITTSKLNYSIPEEIQIYKTTHEDFTTLNSVFILVDISDYKRLDKIVDVSRVVEVIDHHMGFEYYWQKQAKVNIEKIGSVCTLIFERWSSEKIINQMPVEVAKLLISGIIDNTLNLQAQITTNRDKVACQELLKVVDDADWIKRYFSLCTENIKRDMKKALISDMKIVDNISNLPKFIGQLTVYDSEYFFEDKKIEIINYFNGFSTDWMLNIIDVLYNKSVFVTDSVISQNKLETLFNLVFYNGIAYADRSWLRKEIINYALNE